jgi:hypothetical protein
MREKKKEELIDTRQKSCLEYFIKKLLLRKEKKKRIGSRFQWILGSGLASILLNLAFKVKSFSPFREEEEFRVDQRCGIRTVNGYT